MVYQYSVQNLNRNYGKPLYRITVIPLIPFYRSYRYTAHTVIPLIPLYRSYCYTAHTVLPLIPFYRSYRFTAHTFKPLVRYNGVPYNTEIRFYRYTVYFGIILNSLFKIGKNKQIYVCMYEEKYANFDKFNLNHNICYKIKTISLD